MRRTLLAVSCLALLLVAVLVIGTGLGVAQTSQPVPGARPTPTPILPLPEWTPPQAVSPEIPPLPDLIVTKIEVVPPGPVVQGATVTIRVTIKNQSSYDVEPTNNFWSDLYVDPGVQPPQLGQDGVWEWPCQATWVPAGGTHVLEAPYVFDDVKTYSLWAQVDTDAHVLESNENNNLLGPVLVQVVASDKIVHQTHEQFQMGMASSLDASHPQGVIRRGIFWEPQNDPGVYSPDSQIDQPLLPPTHPNNVNQVKPALTSDGAGTLFAVWEDGRDGGVFNRDIYFARSTDQGATWSGNVRVNQGTTGNQLSPDIVYDPTHGTGQGRLYAVWQDERNGNFDIYFAYSDDRGNTWLGERKQRRHRHGAPVEPGHRHRPGHRPDAEPGIRRLAGPTQRERRRVHRPLRQWGCELGAELFRQRRSRHHPAE
jgi:hypothetical protein